MNRSPNQMNMIERLAARYAVTLEQAEAELIAEEWNEEEAARNLKAWTRETKQ